MLHYTTTQQAVANSTSTEYVCRLRFDNCRSDEAAWRAKLLEFGLEHEAFSITSSPGGTAILKFWEPDRLSALRILGKLEGLNALTV